MKKYLIEYKYTTLGYVEVEANSKEEAEDKIFESEDFGEHEQTRGTEVTKITIK